MPIYLWGVSPLYENEGLKEGSVPTVTLIDKSTRRWQLREGDQTWERSLRMCRQADNRFRGRPHSRQSCKATNRNLIQGRSVQVSEPIISETVSFGWIGKSSACAAKVNRIIQGRLQLESGSRACPKARGAGRKIQHRSQLAAEVVVLIRRIPATTGRTEL